MNNVAIDDAIFHLNEAKLALTGSDRKWELESAMLAIEDAKGEGR